ncbi:NodT family efflux transporter outer membrane factor (OMF) lipoprotein [Duganella sp. 3397]|uniref:efflux transporter outer membrane subunit n=1 Tax=Duganella sp. 3397 TaxID=2817732 RepID=UPI00286365A5|nr:efflux transporter outer membrane subunit [Duganella sp. 3397]MDR7052251.1 NodT family efflux transporter outer membrane factor (OMF) lipoprotein [Duganella sp. 3397]
MNRTLRVAVACAMAAGLGACAVKAPAPQVAAQAPAQWQAPLPHNGSRANLATWWREQTDTLLADLIDAAQTVSPTVSSAASRIAQSRADQVAAGAALVPNLDGTGSVSRANQQSLTPMGTTSQVALQASWEVDLFGANRAARDAAQARYQSAQAGWHDARVSVAAETANQYFALRACEQLMEVARQDAASRADTARLTELSAGAGFESPANLALARASAADGNSRYLAQRASCDVNVKALVALTAMAEPELRRRLAGNANPGAGAPAVMPAFSVTELPAQTLAQRPDVFTAEREVAAASAEVGSARAQRYPRLTISGAVGIANFHSGGVNTKTDTWNIGPVSVSVPIFDAGRRRANEDAASARYDAAVVSYRATVRQAVSDVEQAMVNLDSTAQRATDASTATQGYRANFNAVEQRYQNGMASLFELEDARRTRLAAEQNQVTLARERNAAWVALYRAAGGGWTAPATNN